MNNYVFNKHVVFPEKISIHCTVCIFHMAYLYVFSNNYECYLTKCTCHCCKLVVFSTSCILLPSYFLQLFPHCAHLLFSQTSHSLVSPEYFEFCLTRCVTFACAASTFPHMLHLLVLSPINIYIHYCISFPPGQGNRGEGGS